MSIECKTGQIRAFKKNKLDISNTLASITVTDGTATNDGSSFVDFLRNRNNTSAWLTTGSDDAALTQLDFELTDERDLDTLILVCHNFDSYTIQYWDGALYQDFSTPIAVTGNTKETTFHQFDKVETSRLRLIIQGTIVPDADKKMKQFIATENLVTGQLAGWPIIKKPTFDTNKKISKMLSGKVNVTESVGGFGFDLQVRHWSIDSDLNIVEEIYLGKRGVLIWLSAGDEEQFQFKRIGYRNEDIYLMRAVNNYSPEYVSGVYVNGVKITLKLRESIN
jgi:hypothetical protein